MSAKEKLIESATRLFYAHGFHATGVERILTDANVSKMTLYRHFKSKDELILAVLREFDSEIRRRMISFVENLSDDPKERLLGIFDFLSFLVTEANEKGQGFSGCLFANASSEYSGFDNPIHRLAAEHQRLFHEYLAGLASQMNIIDSDSLALSIQLIYEGASVSVHVGGDLKKITAARKVCEEIIEARLPGASA